MRAALHLAIGCVVATAACSKDSESSVSLTREGEAPPVAFVEGSAQLDLGSAEEAEPNNDKAKANPLEMPVAVTGVLTSSKDVDFFSFVAPENGHAKVFLRPADGADFMVEVHDPKSDLIRVGDRGPNTAEGIPNLPVKKGATYHVAVKEYVKPTRRKRRKKPRKGKGKGKGKGEAVAEGPVREGDSPPYQLEVSMVPKPKLSDGVEQENEPNETIDAAQLILSGGRPSGFIGWTDDVDMYKLSLEDFTKEDLIEISVDAIDGVTLNLELTDPDGEKVLTRKGAKSGPIYVRGLTTTGADYFIAKLWAKRSHESQRYRFHFSTRRLQEGDEIEPNDRAKKATRLGDKGDEDGEVRGEIFGSDVDFFVLPTSKTRRQFDVTIDVSGGVRIEVDAIVAGDSLGVARGDVRDMQVIVEPGARLRLKVTAKGSGAPAEYTLTWKTEEAEPAPKEPDPDDPSLQLE